MTNLTKLRKEFEKSFSWAIYNVHRKRIEPSVWSFIEHSLQKADFEGHKRGRDVQRIVDEAIIRQVKKEERERIIDEIEPRLYSLWANIDYVYNKRAREQAKELLDLLEELTQKSKGK